MVEKMDRWMKLLPQDVSGLSVPELPQGLRDVGQVVQLRTGEEYMLAGEIRKVKMGLGWNVVGRGVDIDGSCVMLDDQKRVVDTVFYQQLVSRDGSIKHSGDNLTGEGEGDDEVIKVALDKVPLFVHHLVFIVCIYSKAFTFGDVKTCSVRMVHRKKKGKNPLLLRYDLSGGPGEAMVLCSLVRKGSWWSLMTFGHPVQGRVPTQVLAIPGQLGLLGACQSSWPQVKGVMLTVIRGRNLAIKDKGFFGGGSSDPYFRVLYSGMGGKSQRVDYESAPVMKTLNPEWGEHPMFLGYFQPSDHKVVKIYVWDYDAITGSDFMGEVRIPAACMWNVQGHTEGWFPLRTAYVKPGKQSGKAVAAPISTTKNVKGDIYLRIQNQPAPPEIYSPGFLIRNFIRPPVHPSIKDNAKDKRMG